MPPALDWSESGDLSVAKKEHREVTPMTLTDVLPGNRAHIAGFSDELPFQQREHLQAYGIVAGRTVRVLQHAPVTVVQVEHLELALEAELAKMINVRQGPQRQRRRERRGQ
jgi:Fe2+ transport system protein FeoA